MWGRIRARGEWGKGNAHKQFIYIYAEYMTYTVPLLHYCPILKKKDEGFTIIL